MPHRVLLDSCVLTDLSLPFRVGHASAQLLFRELAAHGVEVHVPSHAYFEIATAMVVHYKRDHEEFVTAPFVDPHFHTALKISVFNLDFDHVMRLMGRLITAPIPDLKSQDMIYYCIAREYQLTLITQDRKLRNVCRRSGIDAHEVDEFRALLHAPLDTGAA